MGISVSLVFIAAGAILKWAVTATTAGVNLGTVGVVLMVVGAGGFSCRSSSGRAGADSPAGTRRLLRSSATTRRFAER